MRASGTIASFVGGAILLCAASGFAQVEWVNFKGNVSVNGLPAPVGSVVDAYDPDGVRCGTYTVGLDNPGYPDSAGIYGFMPVYRDDAYEPGDQGADPGDTITFKVNGKPAVAVGNVVWGKNGDVNNVDLSVSATIALTLVDPPLDKAAAPGDTVRFFVGVRNDGDGLDYYGITAVSAGGWLTINQDTFSYASPGGTAYVYFDVIAPIWPGDTVDNITYTVYSHLDTSKHVGGSVGLVISISDAPWEPPAELPGGFAVHQNYPNPFNPTTTISFSLGAAATVRLDVFDVLGRNVESHDLGRLPLGDHSVEFAAHDLASGVYFYRLQVGSASQTRKMVLAR